jgi:hypothetical protein
MTWLGDWTVGETRDFFFTTRKFSTGAPNVLASGVISAYEDDSLSQITAGVSLSADHDGVVGLNRVRVVATGGNGFEAGKSYGFVITTGTVDSVSVVGEVVGQCSIERGAAHLRIGATGSGLTSLATQASVNTIDDFLDTEVAAILADTDDIQTRLPTLLVSGRMDASVGAMAANVMTAAAAAADLSAEIADAVWDEDATGHQTTGTFGQAIGDPVADTKTIYAATVTDAAGTTIAADIIAVKADTAATLLDTGTDGVIVNAAGLATDAVNEIADGLLTRQMTEAYNADGAAPTTAQALFMILQSLTEFAIASTTITVKKLDGSTSAATFTLDSATTPTSRTRAT